MESVNLCNVCPRECNAPRVGSKLGYCRSDWSYSVGSICIHKGEEPVISGSNGICNVFFTKCNLQCVYCQNHQISNNLQTEVSYSLNLQQVTDSICTILSQGITILGFVSPSHKIAQVIAIIQAVKSRGYQPVTVYNSNGYDKVESLRRLEGLIDIYLPDFKYSDNSLAKRLSGAGNYVEVAIQALKEMMRQKGTGLLIDPEGQAYSGIIIRHLVLPGYINNSIGVLECIASELTVRLHISLMAQYNPVFNTCDDINLQRKLQSYEYQLVVDKFDELGFENGYVQDLNSNDYYNPDFTSDHPFDPSHL